MKLQCWHKLKHSKLAGIAIKSVDEAGASAAISCTGELNKSDRWRERERERVWGRREQKKDTQ